MCATLRRDLDLGARLFPKQRASSKVERALCERDAPTSRSLPTRTTRLMMDAMAALPLARSNDSTETIKLGDLAANADSSTKKQYHRDPSAWDAPVPVVKAYRNADFLNSSHARHLRILAEYEETMQRLRWSNVRATVQFFGSARARDKEQYDAVMETAQAALQATEPGTDAHFDATERIAKLKQTEWMVPYMASIQELARMITQWSVSTRRSSQVLSGVDRTKSALKQSFERNLADLGVADEPEASSDKSVLKIPLAPMPSDRAISPTSARRYHYLPHTTDDNHPEARSARYNRGGRCGWGWAPLEPFMGLVGPFRTTRGGGGGGHLAELGVPGLAREVEGRDLGAGVGAHNLVGVEVEGSVGLLAEKLPRAVPEQLVDRNLPRAAACPISTG